MNKDDILHLGTLARMEIADAEIEALQKDITAVLEYVGVIDDIAGDAATTKKPGAVYNAFREDEVTIEPGSHTNALLAEAPAVENDFVVVKKILNND